MAMDFDDRQPLRGGALQHRGDVIRRPRDLRRGPHGAEFIGNCLDFTDCEAVAAISVATAAHQDRDGLLAVAGEEKTLQVLVLVAREREGYGSRHFSNSRASQSSIRMMCVPRLS